MSVADDYFEQRFFRDLGGSSGGLENADGAVENESAAKPSARIAAERGLELSPIVARFLDALAAIEQAEEVGAFYPAPLSDWLADANAFEHAMGQPFRAPAAFTDSVYIGSNPSGDHWLLDLVTGEVLLLRHDTLVVQPACKSLPVFALLQKTIGELEDEDDEPPEAVLASLAGQAAVVNDVEMVGLARTFASESRVPALHQRARPVLTLLGGSDGWPRDLVEGVAPSLSDASAADVVYWLWRTFFTGALDDLPPLIAEAATHRAGLARDASKVLDEVLGGRKKVGEVVDVHALRRFKNTS